MTKLNKIAKGTGTPKVQAPVKGRILPDLAAQKRIAELEAQVASLANTVKATIKVAKSGGVSVYGLGRFPVTLYLSQWEKLLGMVPEIKTFLKANESKLARKE
jgi:hypothetical protein